MSIDVQERRDRRAEELAANDPQFAAAQPDAAVSAAIQNAGPRLPHVVKAVLEGYSDRPALAQRAVELVKDPQTGRTSAKLLPWFDTVSYGELAAEIRKVIPEARIELPGGRDPGGPGRDTYLDITRIREDVGYQLAYDTERAVADYIGWLRAGNER